MKVKKGDNNKSSHVNIFARNTSEAEIYRWGDPDECNINFRHKKLMIFNLKIFFT